LFGQDGLAIQNPEDFQTTIPLDMITSFDAAVCRIVSFWNELDSHHPIIDGSQI